MKKTVVVMCLLFWLAAIPAMAQEAQDTPATGAGAGAGTQGTQSEADFSSPRPQFFAFHFGVPMGYNLEIDDFVSGFNFGIDFAILDTLSVGFDHIRLFGPGSSTNANLFRMAFSFTDTVGAAVAFGGGTGAMISLGAFGNFFQSRSAFGLVYSLGLRLDYVAQADDFANGSIVFILRTTLGL